jgi:hypothetical protein
MFYDLYYFHQKELTGTNGGFENVARVFGASFFVQDTRSDEQ